LVRPRYADGERRLLDDEELTAAHRSAPFGTRLRVVNLKNGREVVVRVNDRAPFAKDRIIDLSKAAADQLGMIADGVAKVQVSPVVEQVAGN
jgi:rare lipoprotein A